MSDLYDADAFAWAREQAALLRRLEAGEQVNDRIDWPNIIEEVETVGRNELKAATTPLWRAMQHKLYLLGSPHTDNLSVRHWRVEVADLLSEAADEFRESMRKDVDIEKLYKRARAWALRHMDDPPSVPLPTACPWTLDELLAEGRTPE